MKTDIENLEESIGYSFKDRSFIEMALTHTSFANENHETTRVHNERLEFLGDAVLELVSSEYFYMTMPDKDEGEMTKSRAAVVCEPALAACARQFGLENYIRLGRGEEASGGREKASIVSDAMEAVIGAIYLDGGFECAKEFVSRFILNDIEHKRFFSDSKSILQEKIQASHAERLTYELLNVIGPEHDKRFKVCVKSGEKVLGEGVGRTKKAAQQMAAYHALILLQKEKR